MQILFETLRKNNPECDLVLGLVDRQADFRYPENCTILNVEELGLPDQNHFLFRYNAFNLCTAVKPYFFEHLFKMGYESIIYFDSDIAVFNSLDRYFALMENGADFVVTPHFLEPVTAADQPDEVAILLHGTFNLGFIGIRNSSTAVPIVRWWARMLEHNCVTMIEEGVFADQKFIDLVPSFTSRYVIIRDPGANYAYWNMSRRLVKSVNGEFFVNDSVLMFCHFSGFDLNNPAKLSAYGANNHPEDDAGLNALISWYDSNLRRLNAHTYVAPPYAFDRFASGTIITDKTRENFRRSSYDRNTNPFKDISLEDGSRQLEPRSPPVAGHNSTLADTREHLLFALKELDTRTHHAHSLLMEIEDLKAKLARYEQ
ncbi:putative nucleotide-diphospho-sugar transferase [Methylobacterium sp. P1-11]|uniref:putative nucleotide-diphospho-sugar transferase n=1 Tax=Methylobacterium sp. P1-11 TaxID=2024616 RepID=UPI0015633669|nr:putative nucleotide-diphospho-sugar transferase [Methylobacterium sp. P1-11]